MPFFWGYDYEAYRTPMKVVFRVNSDADWQLSNQMSLLVCTEALLKNNPRSFQ